MGKNEETCSEVCIVVPYGIDDPIDPENPDPCANQSNFYLCNPENPSEPTSYTS